MELLFQSKENLYAFYTKHTFCQWFKLIVERNLVLFGRKNFGFMFYAKKVNEGENGR